MAISRAQLLKELLPGLNALFGLEYARYGEEHKEIYETETSERSFEEEKPNCPASAPPRLRPKAVLFSTTTHRKHGPLATTTKPSLLASRSLKKQSKITSTIRCQLATPRLWLAVWLTPSRLKLQQF